MHKKLFFISIIGIILLVLSIVITTLPVVFSAPDPFDGNNGCAGVINITVQHNYSNFFMENDVLVYNLTGLGAEATFNATNLTNSTNAPLQHDILRNGSGNVQIGLIANISNATDKSNTTLYLYINCSVNSQVDFVIADDDFEDNALAGITYITGISGLGGNSSWFAAVAPTVTAGHANLGGDTTYYTALRSDGLNVTGKLFCHFVQNRTTDGSTHLGMSIKGGAVTTDARGTGHGFDNNAAGQLKLTINGTQEIINYLLQPYADIFTFTMESNFAVNNSMAFYTYNETGSLLSNQTDRPRLDAISHFHMRPPACTSPCRLDKVICTNITSRAYADAYTPTVVSTQTVSNIPPVVVENIKSANVTLNTSNASTFVSNEGVLVANASTDTTSTLVNATLYDNRTGLWLPNITVNLTGSSALNISFNFSFLRAGYYLWNVQVANNYSNLSTAPRNFTFFVSANLTININYPLQNNTNVNNVSYPIAINGTITQTGANVSLVYLNDSRFFNRGTNYTWDFVTNSSWVDQNVSIIITANDTTGRTYTNEITFRIDIANFTDTGDVNITWFEPLRSNTSKTANATGIIIDLNCSDDNEVFELNVSVKNASGITILTNYSLNVSKSSYRPQILLNWTNQTPQRFNITATCADPHTNASLGRFNARYKDTNLAVGKYNSSRATDENINRTVIYSDDRGEIFRIDIGGVKENNVPVAITKLNYTLTLDTVNNEIKLSTCFTVPKNNFILYYNITTFNNYRIFMKNYSIGHLIPDKYYMDFSREVKSGLTLVDTQKVTDNSYIVKLQNTSWAVNDFVCIDPAVGALNIRTQDVLVEKDGFINVSIRTPANDSVTSGTVNFTFIPVFMTTISNCSLFINQTGIWNRNTTVTTGITNNTLNNFTLQNLRFPSPSVWNVECVDVAGNINQSSYNFTLTTNSPPVIINFTTNRTIFSRSTGIGMNISIEDNENDTILWANFSFSFPNGTNCGSVNVNGTRLATGGNSSNWTSSIGCALIRNGTYTANVSIVDNGSYIVVIKKFNFTFGGFNNPTINRTYVTITPDLTISFNITAIVHDYQDNDSLIYLNYTLFSSNGTAINLTYLGLSLNISNLSGPTASFNWTSSNFTIPSTARSGQWNWSLKIKDNSADNSETGLNGSFNITNNFIRFLAFNNTPANVFFLNNFSAWANVSTFDYNISNITIGVYNNSGSFTQSLLNITLRGNNTIDPVAGILLNMSDYSFIKTNGTFNVIIDAFGHSGNSTRASWSLISQDVRFFSPTSFMRAADPRNETHKFNITWYIDTNETVMYNFSVRMNNQSCFSPSIEFANQTAPGTSALNPARNQVTVIANCTSANYTDGIYDGTVNITRTRYKGVDIENFKESILVRIGINPPAARIEAVTDDDFELCGLTNCNKWVNKTTADTFTIGFTVNNTGNLSASNCNASLQGDFIGRSFVANPSFFSIPINGTASPVFTFTTPTPAQNYTGRLEVECEATALKFMDRLSKNPNNQPLLTLAINSTIISAPSGPTPTPGPGGGGAVIAEPTISAEEKAILEKVALAVKGCDFDGVCELGEDPVSCGNWGRVKGPDGKKPTDCTTTFKDVICISGPTCPWRQAWFTGLLSYMLIGVGGLLVWRTVQIKQKKRRFI